MTRPPGRAQHGAADDARADETVSQFKSTKRCQVARSVSSMAMSRLRRDIVDQDVDVADFRHHALAKLFARDGIREVRRIGPRCRPRSRTVGGGFLEARPRRARS